MHGARIGCAAFLLAVLAGCASGGAGVDPASVRVVEGYDQEAGLEHSFALPTKMDGCEYLGRVRTQTASVAGSEAAQVLLEKLKINAARKGADTVVVLPAGHAYTAASGTSMQGSAFRCGSPP